MINTLNQLLLNMSAGIIYMDEFSNIIECNALARDILDKKDGLLVSNGMLVLENPKINKQLCHQSKFVMHTVTSPILVSRKNQLPPYKLELLPFKDEWNNKNRNRPNSILLIKDPSLTFNFPKWIFSDHYKLTAAELELTKAIYGSMNLRDYANKRGVKISTVRWTLDNIFSKTFTHSQSELKTLALLYAA